VAATYYANFEAIPTYTVTFVAGDNGSITGTDEFPGILSGTAWADAVTVPTPVPDPGYEFDNWTPSFPATVTESATYTANFKANPCCDFYFYSNDTKAKWWDQHCCNDDIVKVEYHIGGVCINDTIDITVQVRYRTCSTYGWGSWENFGEQTFTDTPNPGGQINVNWQNTDLTGNPWFKEWQVRFIASSNNHNCPDVIEGWKYFAN